MVFPRFAFSRLPKSTTDRHMRGLSITTVGIRSPLQHRSAMEWPGSWNGCTFHPLQRHLTSLAAPTPGSVRATATHGRRRSLPVEYAANGVDCAPIPTRTTGASVG